MYPEEGLWERSYSSIFSHYLSSPPPPGGLGHRADHAQRPGAKAFEDPKAFEYQSRCWGQPVQPSYRLSMENSCSLKKADPGHTPMLCQNVLEFLFLLFQIFLEETREAFLGAE